MPLRHALIVDDSRTASVVLRDMLGRHDISSDAVENAEDGINYLVVSQPDVIFMDHMMPGMDGFEAVKHIKSNPELSAIPIVMYTTQASDVYNGQARALGAVSVLGKPATEEDLVDVLARLALEKSPLTVEVPVVTDADLEGKAGPLLEETLDETFGANLEAYVDAETTQPVPALPEQSSVKQDYDGLPSDDTRFVSYEPPKPGRQVPWFGIFVVGLFALALLLGWQMMRSRASSNNQQVLASIEAIANQAGAYSYGEQPFDDRRLNIVREVVRTLDALGIPAVIELRSHVGEFCRVFDESGQDRLPGPDLPIERCDIIGFEAAEVDRLAQSQSLAFRRYVDALNAGSGKVSVRIVPMGIAQPLEAYPAVSQVELAVDWNSVAAANSRVELKLIAPEAN